MKKINIISILLLSIQFTASFSFINFLNDLTKFNEKNILFLKEALHKKKYRDSHIPKEDPIFFKDIKGGIPQEILDLKENLLHSEIFNAVGAQAPRGILLVGPPGNGKTTIAKAISSEINARFITANAATFQDMYIGTGPAKVQKLFDDARAIIENEGSHVIIFIDEIDSLGNRETGHQETVKTINTLLTNMDGMQSCKSITILAATNAVHLVDDALKRSGRFDYIIDIPLPDYQGRKEILEYYLQKKNTNPLTLDLDILAQETDGLSGADLEGIIKKAATNAARNRHTRITAQDLHESWKKECVTQINRKNATHKGLKLRLN